MACSLTACQPAQGQDVSDTDGQLLQSQFLDSAELLASCTKKGLQRCTAKGDAVEVCDGKKWVQKTLCDAAIGATCIAAVCKSACDQVTRSNIGCSFYPANLWSTATSGQLGIVVSNLSSTLTAKVTLEDGNGFSQQDTIPPSGGTPMGSVAIFRLDHDLNKLNKTEQAKKGFHLSSTTPVAAYLFHPIDASMVFSGSATVLLPEQVMAKNYLAMSYTYNADLLTLPPQGQGFLAVVGLTDNTRVDVKVPVMTLAGTGIPSAAAGSTLTRTVNRLEVLEIAQASSHEDISGAVITANAPVAVYGGAGGVSIPASAIGGTHLGAQLLPVETWGKKYLAAKTQRRNASDKDRYRIVASQDNTHVTLTGGTGLPMVPVLNSGAFFEFATASDLLIRADKPVMTYQYLESWGALSGRYDSMQFPDGVPAICPYVGSADDVKCLGDSNMTPLAPVEQYTTDYIFYVPSTYMYQYVNVLAPVGTKLSFDGMPLADPITKVATDSDTGQDLGRAIVRIASPGNHRITGDKPFGIVGYGYDAFVSYSYVGGLNLSIINPL